MNSENLPGTPLHMQGQLITLLEAVASLIRNAPDPAAAWVSTADQVGSLLDNLEADGEYAAETVLGMRDMAAWLSMRCSPAAPSPTS